MIMFAWIAFFLWPTSQSLTAEGRLIPELPVYLDYHGGPLLAGRMPIKIYLIYYGKFRHHQKEAIRAFLYSISPPPPTNQSAVLGAVLGPSSAPNSTSVPSVSDWWSILKGYTDYFGSHVAQTVELAEETDLSSDSKGKKLTLKNVNEIIADFLRTKALPINPKGIYLVLTAHDVEVESFCSTRCGLHAFLYPSAVTANYILPSAWVGNPESQCPGFCGWPFSKLNLLSKEPFPVFTAPNGIGADAMVINIAKVLAGTVTNPYFNGYYQEDQTVGSEAAGVCTGIFGSGAYPGNPGDVMVETLTRASYNAIGFKGKRFLLPYLWDLRTQSCALEG